MGNALKCLNSQSSATSICKRRNKKQTQEIIPVEKDQSTIDKKSDPNENHANHKLPRILITMNLDSNTIKKHLAPAKDKPREHLNGRKALRIMQELREDERRLPNSHFQHFRVKDKDYSREISFHKTLNENSMIALSFDDGGHLVTDQKDWSNESFYTKIECAFEEENSFISQQSIEKQNLRRIDPRFLSVKTNSEISLENELEKKAISLSSDTCHSEDERQRSCSK